MTGQNSNTEKILAQLSKKNLNVDQVAIILNSPGEFPTGLIEKLSLETALNYWNGRINYIDGDYIMNNIFAFWLTNENSAKDYKFPEIAWECYLAFDSGEYYRTNDDRSSDPAEKYTRPLIRELLIKRQQIV